MSNPQTQPIDPSRSALRCAKVLNRKFYIENNGDSVDDTDLAAVIDQEARTAELLDIVKAIQAFAMPTSTNTIQLCERAIALLENR
jgi:hypothetical protein